MKFTGLKRLACGAAFPIIAFVVQAGATASVTEGCGDSGSCMSLRQTTFTQLQAWEECVPGDDAACILEPGNPKDCTGVLTCPFAINAEHRAAAEQTMLVIGEQSTGCYQCAVPSCFTGNTAYCEPISKRCLIIQTGLAGDDAGTGTDDASAIVLGDGG
jgi:hypothetical protein